MRADRHRSHGELRGRLQDLADPRHLPLQARGARPAVRRASGSTVTATFRPERRWCQTPRPCRRRAAPGSCRPGRRRARGPRPAAGRAASRGWQPTDVGVEVRQQPDALGGTDRARPRRPAARRACRRPRPAAARSPSDVEQLGRPGRRARSATARTAAGWPVRRRAGSAGRARPRRLCRRGAAGPGSHRRGARVRDLRDRGWGRSRGRRGAPASGERLPPARPHPLERRHHQVAGPRPGALRRPRLVSSSTVSSASSKASAIAATTSSVCSGRHLHVVRERRPRLRHCGQRGAPHRQVPRRQQVHGPARAERLDQAALGPQRASVRRSAWRRRAAARSTARRRTAPGRARRTWRRPRRQARPQPAERSGPVARVAGARPVPRSVGVGPASRSASARLPSSL